MKTVRITKEQAVSLLYIMPPRNTKKECRKSLDAAKASLYPLPAPEGTTVHTITINRGDVGPVVQYYISGYAANGSDVDKALKSIGVNIIPERLLQRVR